MRTKTQILKKLLSMLLCLAMLLSYVPITAFAAADDVVCTCDVAEGEAHAEGCALYEASAELVCTCSVAEGAPHAEDCALYEAPAELGCTCGVAEGEPHLEGCALYEAPADLVCTCQTKCAADSVDDECAVCSVEGADLTACLGTEAEDQGISYIRRSWDGSAVVSTTDVVTEYQEVTADTTELSADRWYVVTGDVTVSATIEVKGKVNLILCDGASLTASQGIEVEKEDELYIYGQTAGTGKLTAHGKDNNPAIGPDVTGEAGIVKIYGGDIAATGGENGAGIESIVDIYGGTVTAQGGYNGAGIAGDTSGNGGIGIFGGTVTAKGGYNGAGIGQGSSGKVGTINIYGGTVTATGGEYGAGIGQGSSGEGGKINIFGGTVIANGGYYGAGIGTGSGGSSETAMKITISGGTVTATGDRSTGIGMGSVKQGGTITITGGMINATGKGNFPGIGCGSSNFSDTTKTIVSISGGTVIGSSLGSSSDDNICGIGCGSQGEVPGGTVTLSGAAHIWSSSSPSTASAFEYLTEGVYYSRNAEDATLTKNGPKSTTKFYEWIGEGHLCYVQNSDGLTHSLGCPTDCPKATALGESQACSGGEATCAKPAKCTVCESYYGEVDKTKHDEAAAYVNGFCESGCYEPAVLNGDVYEISNAGQLYWFAAKVNSGNVDIDGKLMKDIQVNQNVLKTDGTLNGDGSNFRTWTPIGNSPNVYDGTFDGGSHTVSGLYFNNSEISSVGLFGDTDKNGNVRNVGVTDSYFKGKSYVGGVVGWNGGTVTGCYNTGTVSGEDNVGGVVGYNASRRSITNCYNTGAVSGSDSVGGVVGNNHFGTTTNCYNTGTVTGTDTSVGGVVGSNEGNQSFIKNCYNTGAVSGNKYVGGVEGYNASGTTTNCYNTGAVSGSRYVGGVVGYSTKTVTNCYYDKTVYTGRAIGSNSGTATKVEGKSTAQFASGEVAYLLSQGENGDLWGQDIGTDQHPVLGGDKVYYGYFSCAEDTDPVYTNDATASAEKPTHSTGAAGDKVANCGSKAYCSVCESYYGEVDKTKHDEAVAYVNGFCEYGCYEPAVLNGDVYEISNAGQLYWFAQQVNSGKTTINGKLMANIVVNAGTITAETTDAREWTPIGNIFYEYAGTFDGAGHTVSGLYHNSDVYYVGLFGRVDTGSISNVGVVNSYLYGKDSVGGVVGENVSGTITDCYNTGTVTGYSQVGGVAGGNNNIMTGCYNTGAVSGHGYIGGVVGRNYDLKTCGTITDCYNTGTVTGTGNDVGGVVGSNEGNQSFIKNCYNTGAVNGGGLDIGGVAGYSYAPITNCYSTGAVSGNKYVGGVVGLNYSPVTNCYSAGAVSGNEIVGGVVGQNYSDPGRVENCYYRNDENGTSNPGIGTGNSGSAEAKTAEQFASGEVAYLLQGSQTEQVWGQDIDNGKPAQTHPVFSNAKVYYGYISCAEDTDPVYTNDATASAEKPTHSTGAAGDKVANCGSKAYCSVCESYYGEVDKTKHDEAVAYVNGFCEYGCYEPAVLNGDVYEISNAGQLYWFAAQVNSGKTAIKGKLMDNITVNPGTFDADGVYTPKNGETARTWTPIGNSSYGYKGTFDGAGFAVSGLYCNNTDADYVGLFGYARTTDSQIKNVGVVNSYIRGNERVGGVLGYGYYSKLTDCYNTGIVSGNWYDVGGVVGSLYYGTVSACYNTGAVTGSEANVGGVAGTIEYSTMSDCYNTGTVTSTDSTVGGVVGCNFGTSSRYSTVSNCYNTGDVSGYEYVGGVVGCNYNAKTTVSKCYNTGSVSCNDNYSDGEIGGVVGKNKGNVRACYSLGPVSGTRIIGGVVGKNYADATVENCYNIGSVSTIFSTSRNIGGVVGENAGTVKTSYYLTGCAADGATLQLGIGHATEGSTTADVEGVTAGMTQAQFASGEVAYLLQGSQTKQVWGQDIDNGKPAQTHPVFSNAKVYYGYFSCAEDTDPVYTNDATASAEKPTHSTGAAGDKVANCGSKAYCSVCESYYGEVDKTKHDEAVAYVNGFCEYGCYEPAVLNGDVYEISNAGQLYWFAQQVNSGKTTIKGKLMDNITVNPGTFDADGVYTPKNGETARTWTPIGNLYDNYCGTFDGAGFTVSGLYCNNTDADYVGLFGRVGTGSIVDTSSISNVGVVNSYIRGNKRVGGVVGANVSGTIKDCYNTGAVSGNKYVGGVAGSNSNIMTGCYNTGAVSGNDSIGGVVGQNSEIETWGTITDCYNTGTVTGTDTSVGGVVGINEGAQSFIKNCYNTGAVNGGGGLGIGGVAGYSNAPITNCYSTGAVSGNQYVGGVLGWNYYSPVTNCYSAGAVSGNEIVGGVVGWNNNDPGMVANCYYRNDENGTSNPGIGTGKSGSAEAKTAEQFASGEVAYLLQGSQTEQVWGQDIDNGKPAQTHPVFSNAKVYYGYISCAEEAGQVYTNNENASETKPVHVPVAGSHTDIGGGKHSYVCDGCGSLQTENHTFKVTTGACVCGAKRPAAVVSAPTANAKKIVFMDVSQPDGLMYNGKAQELIVAGEAEGGTMVYSLDADGDFTADIPTATNAGTYTVYYKVLGDDTHADSAVASLSVTIRKATVWLSTLDMERCKDYDLDKLATGFMNWERPYYDDSNWIPYPTVDLRVYTDAPQGELGTYDLFLEAEYDEANYDLTCVTAKLVVTDHHIFDQYTGTCACGSQAVAKLVSGDTTTYYATADEAFAAVMDAEGGVVTILKDAEINKEHATYTCPVSLVVEDGVTLTLNKRLYVKEKLSGTGTITANGNYEVAAYGNGEIHDITIQCTLYNGATIYSGTFYGNVRGNYGTISGGTFYEDVRNKMDGEIRGGVFHGAVNNKGGTITGGTFNGQLINENVERMESMEVESYGTIINTTPGSFVLGDDFTIKNDNGIINCTAHIWKDGACRLCDYRCNHSDSTHDSCTYENSAEHSFLCTVCSASATQTHTYVDHICACGAGEPYAVNITGAGKVTADVTTAYHGHDYVATLRNENGSGMILNGVMIGSNYYSHWDGDFTYDAQTQQISIPGELVVDDVYIYASCTVKHTYSDNGGSFIEEYANFVNWYDDEAFELEINYGTRQTPQVVVNYVQRTGYTMSGVKIGDTFYGMEDVYLGDEDRTLVIQWQPNTYDAVWMDGSDIYYENIQTYDAKVILPPDPQREGCTFLGWFTAEEGGERVTADTVYTNDYSATYYARFCDHSGNENDRYTYESETEHSIQCSVCLTTVKGSHENLFTVSQDGATCTVSCSANCGYSGTATISATGKTYDGNGVEVVVSKTGSLENTDIPVTLTKDGEAFTGEPVNAGAYTASITLGENENAVVASVEFIIEKANPVIAAAPTPNTLTYTSEALYLIAAGEANGGTMVYSLTENGDYTTTIPQGTNAGDYTVWYYVQGDANHNDSAKDSVSVSIAKATVTVTADAKSKPYGTDNPALTYTSEGLLGDDVLTGALETAATKTSNVGEYDITVGSLANSNYTIHFVGAKLTITKAAAPAITFPTAQNVIIYGQKLQDVQLSFTHNEYGTFNWAAPESVPNAGVDGYALDFYPNEAALNNYDWRSTDDALWIEDRAALCIITQVMVNKADPIYEGLGQNAKTYTGQVQNLLTTPTVQGGTILYSLDEQGEYTETIPTGKDAGEYTVWFKIIGDENYADIPAQSYTVEIRKAELAVIVNNHIITYGDEPANAGAYFHGFQGAESLEDLDGQLTYSYTYSQYGDIGDYEIYASGLESHNYNIICIPGILQVFPKDLFVTADDVTKVFGEEDPALTYQAQGLINGDTITGSLVRGGDERADTYTILRGDLSAGNNYNLIFTPGTFTITRKTLNGGDVTLDQSELPYTGGLRIMQFTVPEGVNYEILDESDRATDVGYYELKIRFLDNYQGTATLAWQIIPVAPEYEAPTAKKLTYSGRAQVLIDAGSTQDGTMVYALSEDGEYTETLPLGTDAGVYILWYKVLGDNNHTDSQPASMTAGIDKASLRVYAQSNTIAYGDAPAHNGVSYQGFLNGQTEEVLGGQLTYTYSYNQYDAVGQYEINVSGLGSNNYNITYYPGVLMVEPKVMDGAAISLPESDLPYTGSQQTVQIAAVEGVTYQVLENSDTATDVGNYELYVQFTGNYQGMATLGWRITPVAPEYEAPTAKALTYSGQAQELIAAGSTQEGTMVYALTVDGEYTEAIPTGLEATTYTVWYKVLGDRNHTNTAPSALTVTISQKQLADEAVVLSEDTAEFDGTDRMPTITVSDGNKTLEEGVDYTVTVTKDGEPQEEVKDAGEYVITVSGQGNYNMDIEVRFTVTECTHGGNTNTDDGDCTTAVECSVCHQIVTAAKDAHAFAIEVSGTRVDATCVATGSVTMQCVYCDATEVLTMEIDAGNHTGETVLKNAVVVGCGSDGYSGDTYCADCDTLLEKGEVIPATGEHNYATEVPGTRKDATCMATGSVTMKCLCGATKVVTLEIDPENHTGNNTVRDALEATCEKPGYTGDTYCECGAKIASGEPIPVIDHNYQDGTCTECGGKDPAYVAKFDIDYANMTLGNSLAMNFAFAQSHRTDWTGCSVQIVKTFADGRPDKVVDVPYTQWEQTGINGSAYWKVKFSGVAAKEMSDIIYVTVYDADGKVISNVWEDSVRAYAMRMLSNRSSTQETMTMAVDMLNYGAAAQDYFGYNTADLANNQLSEAQKALATKEAKATNSRVSNENYLGTNLRLESRIQLRMAFKDITDDMYAVIEFTSHTGSKVSWTVPASQMEQDVVVCVDQMVVADGRVPVTVTIYNADGTVHATATDSMESYIARMSSQHAVYEMILKFSDSAYNYFH